MPKKCFLVECKNGRFSVIPAGTRSIVIVCHFWMAPTAPPSFVNHGPKLRVLILAKWHKPQMAKNRDELGNRNFQKIRGWFPFLFFLKGPSGAESTRKKCLWVNFRNKGWKRTTWPWRIPLCINHPVSAQPDVIGWVDAQAWDVFFLSQTLTTWCLACKTYGKQSGVSCCLDADPTVVVMCVISVTKCAYLYDFSVFPWVMINQHLVLV